MPSLNTISLYIHWPFCVSKCPYCDFNSHVAKSLDADLWEQSLLTELKTLGGRISPETTLETIYFGGGTPSLMRPETVQKLIDSATKMLGTGTSIEITLEANPTTFEEKKFKNFRQAGVNRLSLGIQSFDDSSLRFLGRAHDAKQALSALENAFVIFPRVSFDLIYGLPKQTLPAWRGQLAQAALFSPSHISCYQLTFEPGTPFYTRFQRGDLTYPSDTKALQFDRVTEKFWEQYGLKRYEVSNYAKPGYESRHNLAYWQRKPTLGIGPGAHGRPLIKDILYAEETHRAPETWLSHVQKQGHGLKRSVTLAPKERLLEWLLMGLRLANGINPLDCTKQTGQTLRAWGLEEPIEDLAQQGFLICTPKKIKASPQGRACLNAVLTKLSQALH